MFLITNVINENRLHKEAHLLINKYDIYAQLYSIQKHIEKQITNRLYFRKWRLNYNLSFYELK